MLGGVVEGAALPLAYGFAVAVLVGAHDVPDAVGTLIAVNIRGLASIMTVRNLVHPPSSREIRLERQILVGLVVRRRRRERMRLQDPVLRHCNLDATPIQFEVLNQIQCFIEVLQQPELFDPILFDLLFN